MNTVSNKSFSAFIGIDWADAKHDVCVQAAGDERREFSCMPHKVEAIDNWAQSLYRRFGGQMAVRRARQQDVDGKCLMRSHLVL